MKIYINRIDYTAYYIPNTLSIIDEINARSVCNFQMVDTTGSLSLLEGYQIEIFNEDVEIFGGFLTFPKRFNPIGTNTLYFDVECIDNNSIADRRVPNYSYSGNISSDTVVKSILTNYLEDEEVWYNPYSIFFNGVNQYAYTDLTIYDNVTFLNFPYTIQGWIYLEDRTTERAVGSINYSSNRYFTLEINTDGYLRCARRNTTEYLTVDTGEKINSRTWTHVAVEIISSTSLKFYKNGILNSSFTGLNAVNPFFTTPIGANYTIQIGAMGGTSLNRYFYGYIDEFRIINANFDFIDYNKEIVFLRDYGLYYKFNEGTGTVADCYGTIINDAGGTNVEYQPPAILVNTPTYSKKTWYNTSVIRTGKNVSNPQYLRNKYCSEIFDELSEINGFMWYIDFNKRLYFLDPKTFPAEYNINDSSSIRNVNYRQNNIQYRNKQFLRGGFGKTDTITTESPSPKPDGVTRTFILTYPVASVPTIYINSVAVSASDVGIKEKDTGKKWYYQLDDDKITQDTSQTVLSTTDTITVTYQGFYPIFVSSEDLNQIQARKIIQGGTGIVEKVESVSDINDSDYALDYTNGILRKFTKTQSELTYETFTDGLFSGVLQYINLTKYGIDSEFLIDKVEIRDFNNGTFVYFIHAVSGFSFGSWQTFFGNMKKKLEKQSIREDEILVNNLYIREISDIVETQTVSIIACDFPSDTLFPSNTLFPC